MHLPEETSASGPTIVSTIIIISLTALVLLKFAYWVAQMCLRLFRDEAAPKDVAQFWRGLCRFLMHGPQAGDDPEIEERVRRQTSDVRVQVSRMVAVGLWIVVCRRAGSFAATTLQQEGAQSSSVRAVAFVLFFSGLSTCVLWRRSLVSRSLIPWHVFLITMWHISNSPLLGSNDMAFGQTQRLNGMGTLGLSFMCLHLQTLVATNLIQSVAYTATSVALMLAKGNSQVGDLVAAEVFYLLFRLSVVTSIVLMMDRSIRREVEASAGACERSAVTSLLGLMCDAVVDLDQGGAVKEHVPNLAGILMHGTGSSVKGRFFSDFIATDEDRRRFEEAVGGGQAQRVPSMLVGSIRDSIGNPMRAVLYHVPYLTIAGSVHHLLGIREDADGQAVAVKPLAGDACEAGEMSPAVYGRVAMPEAVLTDAVRRGLGARGRWSSRGGRSVGSSSGSSSQSSNGDDNGGEEDFIAEVWATTALEINSLSGRLGRRLGVTGSAKNRSFLEMLPQDSGEELAKWIVDNAQKVMTDVVQPFIGSYGEIEVIGRNGIAEMWPFQVCFPRYCETLRQRQKLLVGIRFTPPTQTGGTPRHVPSQSLISPRSARSGRRMRSL